MDQSKDDVARNLIHCHFRIEPDLSLIYRVRSEREDDPDEPIKLIEVNDYTLATGMVDAFRFARTKEFPFPTVIAEITPGEHQQLRAGKLPLPRGWSLDGADVYERPQEVLA